MRLDVVFDLNPGVSAVPTSLVSVVLMCRNSLFCVNCIVCQMFFYSVFLIQTWHSHPMRIYQTSNRVMSVSWLRGGGIHKNGFHRTYSPANWLWSHTHNSVIPSQTRITPLPHANSTVWSPRFRRYLFSISTLLDFTCPSIITPRDLFRASYNFSHKEQLLDLSSLAVDLYIYGTGANPRQSNFHEKGGKCYIVAVWRGRVTYSDGGLGSGGITFKFKTWGGYPASNRTNFMDAAEIEPTGHISEDTQQMYQCISFILIRLSSALTHLSKMNYNLRRPCQCSQMRALHHTSSLPHTKIVFLTTINKAGIPRTWSWSQR